MHFEMSSAICFHLDQSKNLSSGNELKPKGNSFMSSWCIFKDEEEAGLLEQVKSQICDNLALYAQKYDEEFSPHLPAFVTAIWNLLVSTDQKVKYDLVSVMNSKMNDLSESSNL